MKVPLKGIQSDKKLFWVWVQYHELHITQHNDNTPFPSNLSLGQETLVLGLEGGTKQF